MVSPADTGNVYNEISRLFALQFIGKLVMQRDQGTQLQMIKKE